MKKIKIRKIARSRTQKALLRRTKKLTGDILELGVAGGDSLIRILKWQIDHGCKRRLYAFDTFEGYPAATNKDGSNWLEFGKPNYGKYTLDYVRRNLTDAGFSLEQVCAVTFIKGLIPHTLQEYNGREISLINLDLNLYEPILQSLDILWDKIERGGIVILDEYDYGNDLIKHPGAKLAVDEFTATRNLKVRKNIYGKAYLQKKY
jgi:hypothetical protein